jgi:superfamily II DNA or RNA helicase
MRSARKIYNSRSLEIWFQRLELVWEDQFSPEIIHAGRELYRRGGIGEIEVAVDSAIIHFREERQDYYTVIEWEQKDWKIRSSTPDNRLAQTLAVAGLYEIEELIADEGPALPPKSDEAPVLGLKKNEPVVPTSEIILPDVAPRSLSVDVIADRKGVRLRAFWIQEGRKINIAGHELLGEANLHPQEREWIIRLTSHFHENAFRPHRDTRDFLLTDMVAIPSYLQHKVHRLRKYCTVNMDERLARYSKGVQTVVMHLDAKLHEGGVRVGCRMQVGNVTLTPDQVQWTVQRAGQSLIHPELGLFKLSDNAAELLMEWAPFFKQDGVAEVPLYMILSVFSGRQMNLHLSDELIEMRNRLMAKPVSIDGLPSFLRTYQNSGIHWLQQLCSAGCHPLLADEMGLGKTLQILCFLDLLNRTKSETRIMDLIVCPASVIPVWEMEVQRFFPQMKTRVLRAGTTIEEGSGDLLWLASYSQVRRQQSLLETADFRCVILDEGQFIKNPEAKVTQACCALKAQHRIVLTGTPVENSGRDLWTLFRFLMPGLLGGRRRIEEALQQKPVETLHKMHHQLKPFILRRTKRDVLPELPSKQEIPLYCELTDHQASLYERITSGGLAAFGKDWNQVQGRSISLLALLMRLRQTCCDPSLIPRMDTGFDHSIKRQVLCEKLPELLHRGHRIVIFSQFVQFLNRIRTDLERLFPEIPLFELTGSTRDRQKPVAAFQKEKGAGIMLVSLKAGGTGVTLHAADYVFLMDPWWNPAVEQQAIDRVHRIGQKQPVFIYRLITRGTIEERIEILKAQKQDFFDQTVGGIRDLAQIRQFYDSIEQLIAYQIKK